MTSPRKIYLIYSPCVAEQISGIRSHPLIIEQGFNIRPVKLADLSALHIKETLNHALLWIEQKDYPKGNHSAHFFDFHHGSVFSPSS